MIISYSRNFIFIKTKKTAGTTVEAVLATGCHPGDVIQGVQGAIYRGSGLVIPGLQNAKREQEESPDEDDRNDDDEYDGSGLKVVPHMSAKEVRELVGRQFWRSAFKITVERHP